MKIDLSKCKEKKYFSFIVKTDFQESHHRFDQCGIYACSPEDSSFKAVFSDMKLTECSGRRMTASSRMSEFIQRRYIDDHRRKSERA